MLTNLINLLTSATEKLGQLMASLTGQTTYINCVIEKLDSGLWRVQGYEPIFDTEEEAEAFCETQAGGRRLTLVVCDFPRKLPEGDYVGPKGENIAEIMKELEEYAAKKVKNEYLA